MGDTMNRLLNYLLVVIAFSFASVHEVQGGYIHWLIDDASVSSETSYAKLRIEGAGVDSPYLTSGNLGADTDRYYANNLGWKWTPQFSQIAQNFLTSDYKFIIELYDAADGLLSTFNEYTGDILARTYGPGAGADSKDYFIFENQNIPEPTSGMLALFGLGLLALRRKQKKA